MPRSQDNRARTFRAQVPAWWMALLVISSISLASPRSYANLFADSAALLDAYHREQVAHANARLRGHGLPNVVDRHLKGLDRDEYGVSRETIYDKRGIEVELSVLRTGYTRFLLTMEGSATRPHVNARHGMDTPEHMLAHLTKAFLRLNPGLLELKSSVQHFNESQRWKAPHLTDSTFVRDLEAAEGMMREAAKRCDIWLSNQSKVIKVQGAEFFVRRTHQFFRVSELRKPGGPRRAGNVVLGFLPEDYKLGLVRTTYRPGVLKRCVSPKFGSTHSGGRFERDKRAP